MEEVGGTSIPARGGFEPKWDKPKKAKKPKKPKEETGGAIRKPKRRTPKKPARVLDADVEDTGGAIRKPKRRSPKKPARVLDADVEETGGAVKKPRRRRRYHDRVHRHLMENLSGRGGRFDSPFVRKKMHEMLQHDPTLWQSYVKGKYHMPPHHAADHPGLPLPKQTVKQLSPILLESRGGSMPMLTHFENGRLAAHDSSFYNSVEIV